MNGYNSHLILTPSVPKVGLHVAHQTPLSLSFKYRISKRLVSHSYMYCTFASVNPERVQPMLTS